MGEVYKMLLFLKRRPGMSVEDFRAYYESTHVKLCEKYAVGAQKYVRRFIDPVANPATGQIEEMEFDVITEIWITDRKAFETLLEFTAKGVVPPEIIEDEKKLFDRARSRAASVVEHESDLDQVRRDVAAAKSAAT